MRWLRFGAPVGGLVAGLGLLALGGVLVLSVSLELGLAAVLAAVGVLGFALGRQRSKAADRALVAEVERQIDERRTRELREAEERLREEGVSPVEQFYRDLLPGADGADAPPSALDARLQALIEARCEQVWQGIRDRRYVRVEDGRIVGLDGGAIFAEFRSVVKEVARIYKRDEERAELEARIGDVALSARSCIGDLLQAARRVPVVDVTGWSVADVVTNLERVQKARRLYRKFAPWQYYAQGATLGARLLFGMNPVTLVAWTAGQEAAIRIGAHVARTYAEVWLKELLEASVAAVCLRVARTYDPRLAYRSADWLALVEALGIHRAVPGIDHNRKLLLDCILRAQIPDEFAKLTLLRALAEDAEPVPAAGVGPPVDLAALPPGERRAVADRLAAILQNLQGLREKRAGQQIESIEERLSIRLPRAGNSDGSRAEVRVEAGFVRLAELARHGCGLEFAAARDALAGGAFGAASAKRLGDVETHQTRLERALARVYAEGDRAGAPDDGSAAAASGSAAAGGGGLVDPLRVLVGDPLAGPLAASVADLLVAKGSAERSVEHDHLVLDTASLLLPERKQVEALWSKYLRAVAGRLRGCLLHPKPSSVPPVSAPAVLRQIGSQRLPTGDEEKTTVVPPPAPQPVAVFEARDGNAGARWVLLFRDRVVVGVVPQQELAIDVGEPRSYRMEDVRFGRRAGIVTASLVLDCGAGTQRLTVEGPVVGSFAGHFGPVLGALGIDAAALETMPA